MGMKGPSGGLDMDDVGCSTGSVSGSDRNWRVCDGNVGERWADSFRITEVHANSDYNPNVTLI